MKKNIDPLLYFSAILLGNPIMAHYSTTTINAPTVTNNTHKNTNMIETHNPINMDFTLHKLMVGGNSIDVINGICNTNNSKIIADNKSIEFIFDDDKNTALIGENCNYFKAGSYTAVYVIKEPNNDVNLLLRLTTIDSGIMFETDAYNDNKKLDITKNLPDYLYYGILNVGEKKYNYAIVKIYKVMDDMLLENINNRKLFFRKLLQLLMKLESKNYLINDLKPDNIGYDVEFNPVIIDYDSKTITQEIGNTQSFWCPRYLYDGPKQMIDGFIAFIFLLFFKSPFLVEPWFVNACHSRFICGIMEAKNELESLEDVDFEYFDFLKNLIITDEKRRMLSYNIPTFAEILKIYNNKYPLKD